MKIKFLISIAILAVASVASAQDYRHREYGNYVGPVTPRGNVYYEQHRRPQFYGCSSNCALAILGAVAVGAVIVNETRQTPPPQVVYVPPPQVVYVPSQVQCDGGLVINNGYYCPVYR